MSALTIEDAQRVLQMHGCWPAEPGERPTCPRCRNAKLTISQNGVGPTFHCDANCDGIGAWLEVAASVPLPGGPNVDPVVVLREKLNLPELTKVVKHGRGGSAYNLHLDDGRVIAIGSIATLANQAKFRTAFLPQVRRSPPRYKVPEWDAIVEQIEQAAEERDAVATQADETMSWVFGSLMTGRLKRNVNVDNSAEMFDLLVTGSGGRPSFFDQSGRLHLRLEHMIEWLGRISVRVTMPELSARLSELDFERVQHAARRGDEIRKARYWVSPTGIEDRL